MKITKNTSTYEKLAYNEITNTWGKLFENIELKKYELNKHFLTVEGDKKIIKKSDISLDLLELSNNKAKDISNLSMTFFNKSDALLECYSIGKKFFKIYEKKLKEIRYNPVINEIPSFITLDSLNTKTKTNEFINDFLPRNKIFSNIENNKEVEEIIINYCENNGFPLFSGEEYVDENSEKKYYYFEIQPFVSLTIIIYIIFELQNAIRSIFDLVPELKTDIPLTDINNSLIKNELNILQTFYWFLNIEDNTDCLTLQFLINRLCEIFNQIEHSTVYLEHENNLYFSSKTAKFYVVETYSSIMAMAWNKLKKDILSFYYTENPSHFKKCIVCGQLFETANSNEKYCQDTCKKESQKKNSQKNYYKVLSKLEELTCIFNNLTKAQQANLSKDDLEIIKKFAKMKPTDIKNKYKDKNKIATLQKYIDIMNNLK